MKKLLPSVFFVLSVSLSFAALSFNVNAASNCPPDATTQGSPVDAICQPSEPSNPTTPTTPTPSQPTTPASSANSSASTTTQTSDQPLNAGASNCNLDAPGSAVQKICNPLEGEKVNNLTELVVYVLNKIFQIIGVIAVLMIVIAGFRLVAMASNEKEIQSAKTTITNAVIGLVIAALAYTIVAVVQNTLT